MLAISFNLSQFSHLKPSGYHMYQRLSHSKTYILPTEFICTFLMITTKIEVYSPAQNYRIGFNEDSAYCAVGLNV
jgi:hypothetical protein